jgi:hypothetical protein
MSVINYRVCFLDQEGHIKSFVGLNCRDDGAAIEEARQLLDGQDIELWSGERKVAKLDRKLT